MSEKNTSEAIRGSVQLAKNDKTLDFPDPQTLVEHPDLLSFTFKGPAQKIHELQGIFARQPNFDNNDIVTGFTLNGSGPYSRHSPNSPLVTSLTVTAKKRDALREVFVEARAEDLISVPLYYSLWNQSHASAQTR